MSISDDRRLFLVINPGARGGRSRTVFDRIVRYFNRRHIGLALGRTATLDDATLLARQACIDGYETVVAIGGDGTINRVLNGFFTPDGRLISRARLGVIHVGTSPDLCRSYGIPTAVEAACETVCTGGVRDIPVGMIRYTEGGGGRERADDSGTVVSRSVSFFACCANIGVGAHVADCANSGIRKICGDAAGTFLALLRVLLTYRPATITEDVDGKETTMTRVYNISIGRTFHVASGIKIAHELTDADTRLYALTVRKLGPLTLPGCLRALYAGKPFPERDIFNLGYGRHFGISALGRPVGVEFDGDAAGSLPCTIGTAADRLPLLCGGVHAY